MPTIANVLENQESNDATTTTTRLFATVELVEAILLNLSCKEALLAQRVCKAWQDTIIGSKKLQAALYFTPVQPQYQYDPKSSRRQTTLGKADECTVSDILRDLQRAMHSETNQPRVNPFIEGICAPNARHNGFRAYPKGLYNSLFNHNMFNEGRNKSLERMFAVQPPSKNVMVVVSEDENWRCNYDSGYVKNVDGVTIADVLQHVEKLCRNAQCSYSFAVRGCKVEPKD